MSRARPLIAFFDYPDVFEDFYPHFGVDQKTFGTCWAASSNHAFLRLLQREVGDVIWYAFSLAPELDEAHHVSVGCTVKFLRSSWPHRWLWNWYYHSSLSWRWKATYPAYELVASYLALASRQFLAALRRDRPDVLFVQDYATGRFDELVLIAKAMGVPLIAYHTGSRPESYAGRLAKHWTIRRADRIIASSRGELEMLATRFRVPRERLCVILTPIDTAAFRPLDRDAACCAADLDPQRRYLLFVGRHDDAVKRISAIIRGFAPLAVEHPDVDLLIAGDGPDGARLRQLAEELAPGRVRFVGWVSGPESLVPLYNAAECLLLPSRSEGFPSVIGEALACGTPALASHVGGIGELVVDGETGWLVPPGDDEALAGRIAFVVSNPGVVAAMRPRARAMAERRVSPEAVTADLRQCFSVGGMRDV